MKGRKNRFVAMVLSVVMALSMVGFTMEARDTQEIPQLNTSGSVNGVHFPAQSHIGMMNTVRHSHANEGILTTAARIEAIQNSTDFVQNIIVATPVEIIQGTTDTVSFANESCELLITDYYFEVISWAFGSPGSEIIRVRSQVGNVFEIGNEYTFAAVRVNSVFFDEYNVSTNAWILNNSEVSESDLNDLLNSVGRRRAVPFYQPAIIEEALPTEEFISNVDVAVIVTITGVMQDELDGDVFSAILDLEETVKGNLRDGILNELVRLRGNVVVGGTYLILFNTDEYGSLTLAARNGAIIPINSNQFDSFMEIMR